MAEKDPDDVRFNNWLNGTLSLQFLKDGLAKFVDIQASAYHTKISKSPDSQQPVCSSSCTAKDVKTHFDNTLYMKCEACNYWLQQIIENTTNITKLRPENCDPRLWPTVPWEVCKIYLPAIYKTSESVTDVDIVAILTLFQSCTYFVHTSKRINELVKEILVIRNDLFDSEYCNVGDQEIKKYLEKALQFLKEFADVSGSEVQYSITTAIKKINELQTMERDLKEKTIPPKKTSIAFETEIDTLKKGHSLKLNPIATGMKEPKPAVEQKFVKGSTQVNHPRIAERYHDDDLRFNNWLRGTLSLQFLKDGLYKFVDIQASAFHTQILESEPSICISSCAARDVGKSIYYKLPMNCQACNGWLQTIIENTNDITALCPENCDPLLWPKDPWEVCKIYLPAIYKTSESVVDVDISAILTLFQRCTYFHKSNNFDKHGLVKEILDIRNILFDSAYCNVGKEELQNYLGMALQFLNGFTDVSDIEQLYIDTAIEKITGLYTTHVIMSVESKLPKMTLSGMRKWTV